MASAFGSRSGWARAGGRDKAHLQTWSLALEPPTEPVELARALIAAAVLAPSDWNCQPWRFEVDGTIRVVADRRRGLPALDPTGRGMMISLGAALENLLVAARAYGLRPTVTYFPRGLADPVVAEVSWATGDARRDRGLFHSIPLRRTNRRVFDGRGIFPENRAQIAAQLPDSYRMYWMDSEDDIRELAELGRAAAEARAQNDRMAAEQYEWTRFGDDDALRRGDGITVDALEYGGLSRWFSRRYLDPKSRMNRFGVEATGRRAYSCLRTAGAVALLVSEKAGASAWLMGGQAYERVSLKATQLGIAHQPINEAIDIPDLRAELLRRFGVASGEPLMLVRLGHAKRPDPAPRRSVAMVAAFKNT